MTKIAKISLDIRKDNIIDNEPIVLRQGDSDVTIEASISNDGYPDFEISFATFVAKKPDGTIISNDPANVSGNVISYPVSKHLTESVGQIQDAYFMINNEVTTNGFDISVIPSTQLDDTSVNYIPGIENINKFLESTEADWLGRIQQMKAQIDGLNVPDEFKLLMDKALSDAKAQYQPTIDAAEKNVENIAADLAAKKLDLTNNSDQLNQTITNIKAQVSSITSFLDNVQKQIIEANTSFTAGQQATVSQSIADSQKKLADSIASMQSKFESDSKDLKSQSDQVIADLKSSSNVAITDMQNNQSTAMAKVNQDIADLKNSSNAAITDMQNNQSNAMAKVNKDITDTEAIIQKMQYSAVGTNLLTNTGTDYNPGIWSQSSNSTYSVKDGVVTVSSKDRVVLTSSQQGTLAAGDHVVLSVDVKGTGNIKSGYNNGDSYEPDSPAQTVNSPDAWKRFVFYRTLISLNPQKTQTFSVSAEIDSDVQFRRPKLEKGFHATDWSPNPEEIATNDSVQTAISNAIKVDVGKTITATDDTGKTVNLKITNIS